MSFEPAVNYAAPDPFSVAIGDLNGDGQLDVVVTNLNTNNVSVLVGAGDGSLAAPFNLAVGTQPVFVGITDFDRDGRADMVVANAGSNNITALRNRGSNGNLAFTARAHGAGLAPNALAFGDITNDGLPEVMVANSGSNTVTVFVNDWDHPVTPNFFSVGSIAVGSLPVSVAVGHLNGDAVSDLVVANSGSSNLRVHIGQIANFTGGATYPGPVPSAVVLGDLNGDGKLDMAVANSATDNVSVRLGTGTGTFGALTDFAAGNGPGALAIGDLNGDGLPDLAVANSDSNDVSVLLGNGDGTFAPAVNFGAPDPRSVAIGDLNGDGKLDLAVANLTTNNVSVLLNNSPSIGFTSQPQSQSVTPDSDAVFSVTTSGTGPLAYQWRRNGLPIAGATSSTLTIRGALAINSGIYDVQVSGGCNPTAVVTSHPAVLTVVCPADFNNSGFISVQDLFDFLAAFFTTCP